VFFGECASTLGLNLAKAIQGIRLDLVGEDRERYDMQYIDFAPDSELGEIAQELRSLIEELSDYYRRNSNRQGEE
jgi:hypothetical protein